MLITAPTIILFHKASSTLETNNCPRRQNVAYNLSPGRQFDAGDLSPVWTSHKRASTYTYTQKWDVCIQPNSVGVSEFDKSLHQAYTK